MRSAWTETIERYLREGRTVSGGDRTAQGQAKSAVNTDTTTANTLSGESQGEHAQLSPFYTQEMHAQHGFTPGQTNELLDYAGAGTGGSASSITGEAGLEAARTRNASGFTKSLDEAARDKAKAAAGMSEGVAVQDVLGAKELNQEGARGMEGLYGTDTRGMLEAMGQRTKDIGMELEAGKSGWLQNLNSTISSIGGAATGAADLKKAL